MQLWLKGHQLGFPALCLKSHNSSPVKALPLYVLMWNLSYVAVFVYHIKFLIYSNLFSYPKLLNRSLIGFVQLHLYLRNYISSQMLKIAYISL